MPQGTKRRRSAASRSRAANRARTALPRRRHPTRGQTLARRGMVIIGSVIAISLVIALAATSTSTTSGTPNSPVVTSSAPNDPRQLIAAATANPNNPDLVRTLADYYDQTGQYQNELVLYQQYLNLRPDDADGHISFGDLLANTGDIQGAQSQYAQAIALQPTNASAARAHLGLGRVDIKLRPPRTTDALNEFQQAAALDPTGQVGDEARTLLAALQQQLNIATVTVIAPGSGSPAAAPSSPAPPTRTP